MAVPILIHENSKGIQMHRYDYSNRSKVTVSSTCGDKKFTHRIYRFNRLPETFQSPYISWANLDCCGGWSCDEGRLLTAVQNGEKLYAQISLPAYDEKSIRETKEIIHTLRNTLSPEYYFGKEKYQPTGGHNLCVCRTGKLSDYYDLSAVFAFYEKLGISLSKTSQSKIRLFCDTEISAFASEIPFRYVNAALAEELIVTGLLLGYPLESTASILEGF